MIANSLSITIAQRTREFATLRTLGATRGQVRRSIFIEALVIGTIASVTGLFLGLLLAKGLFGFFSAIGFTLPNTGIIFGTRTVIVSLLVGIVVTLVASLRPAIRATRVPPIAAVREGATLPPSRFARFRTPGSLIVTALGFAAVIYGLFSVQIFGQHLGTTGVLVWMGLGALLVFIGVSLVSVRFVRPLAWSLGPPVKWLLTILWLVFLFVTPLGWIYQVYYRLRYKVWPTYIDRSSAAELARDNARRNPQRTASTAAALMIGLALVTMVSLLASGILASFTGAVDKIWTNADYAITAQNNFDPIPISAANAAAKAPGIEAVANVRTGDARAYNKNFFATAVNPVGGSMFLLDWKEGSQAVFSELGADGAFVDDGYAKRHKLHLGSPITLTFASGAKQVFKIKGIFNPPTGGSPFGTVTISQTAWDKLNPDPKNLYSFVRMRGGVTPANQAALDASLKDFPNAKAQTRQKFIDNQTAALKGILNVFYVLLALSVIVSVFGIVNTLVLTVFERTREIGMLRAIGMTRPQVRRMIRQESVITALIGGVLGILLGIVLGGLLIYKVDFIVFSLPVVSVDHLRARRDLRRHPRRDLPGETCIEAEHPRGAPVRMTTDALVRLLQLHVADDAREEADRCAMVRLARELKEPLLPRRAERALHGVGVRDRRRGRAHVSRPARKAGARAAAGRARGGGATPPSRRQRCGRRARRRRSTSSCIRRRRGRSIWTSTRSRAEPSPRAGPTGIARYVAFYLVWGARPRAARDEALGASHELCSAACWRRVESSSA